MDLDSVVLNWLLL